MDLMLNKTDNQRGTPLNTTAYVTHQLFNQDWDSYQRTPWMCRLNSELQSAGLLVMDSRDLFAAHSKKFLGIGVCISKTH